MEEKNRFKPDPELKLMDQVHQVLQHYDYSYNTEKIYSTWIIKFIQYFNSHTYSPDMENREINVFLDHLKKEKTASPATRKQALNALTFLYQRVLNQKVPDSVKPAHIKKNQSLPMVLTQEEILKIFSFMKKRHLLMAQLIYGCGLRLKECLRLRIQDLNFGDNKIHIRSLKNSKARFIMLPVSLRDQLIELKERVRELHKNDLRLGYGLIDLPETMSVKSKTAVNSFGYQYLFSAGKTSKDPRSGIIRRHHVQESGLQKAVRRAGKRADIKKKVTCLILRNSFAVHMLENGVDIRNLQKLMGHSNLNTTKVFLKVMKKDPPLIISPLDILLKQTL